MSATYYNYDLEVRISFEGDKVAMLGNREDEVSDEVIFDLFEGKEVDGWELVS